jgi:hypothetical protein
MSFLWEGVKQMSAMAGAAALLAGQRTKLRGEIMLVEREMKTRQQTFGVELYDFVAPLAKSPDFFAADDQMTDVIRGPFLAAQREIAALMIKRGKLKEELAQAEVARKAAFPAPATTFGEQVLNTGKATAFTANEVKIKTEIGMVDAQIRSHKEDFGENMFDTLVKLEDEQGWLPTVRDIRTMYDKARQDVDKLKTKADTKEREITTLGTEGDVAASNFSTTATSAGGMATNTTYGSSNTISSTSAHSRPSPLGPQLVVAPAPISAPAPALTLDSGSNHSNSGMFASSSHAFGGAAPAAPAPPPASYGAPAAPYSDPFGSTPAAASGLFLGLAGDGSSAANAASAMGTSYGIRKPQPKSHASTSSAPDPFASMSSGSGHHSHVDPFAPQPQQYPMDPFGGGAAQQQQQQSLSAVPNDPFSFTQPSLSSATAPAALPYDPFKSSLGGGNSSSSGGKQDDDPFADLVASGQR